MESMYFEVVTAANGKGLKFDGEIIWRHCF